MKYLLKRRIWKISGALVVSLARLKMLCIAVRSVVF